MIDAHKSLLEIMREGGYSPKGGKPIPIELIYQANFITREQYEAEVNRQRRVAQAGANASAINSMEAESEALNQRAIRAGVPKRFLEYAINLTHIEDLNNGNGVYIFGSQGAHKTTLACSMFRGWLHDNMFGVGKFIRSTTLMSDFKEAFSNRESESAIMRQNASVDMLLIDDLGKEVASNWAVSKLWELFDIRYGEKLPTIVTSQHAPSDLINHLSENGQTESALAIVSRLRETYLLIDMGNEDKR